MRHLSMPTTNTLPASSAEQQSNIVRLNEELALAASQGVGSPIDLPNQAEFNHTYTQVSRIPARVVVVSHSSTGYEAAHF
jgi:hypothetical protein